MKQPRHLPEEGLVRLAQVLQVIPVGKSTWFRGIAAGKYPKPVKIGSRASAWRVEEIRECIAAFSIEADATTQRKDRLVGRSQT